MMRTRRRYLGTSIHRKQEKRLQRQFDGLPILKIEEQRHEAQRLDDGADGARGRPAGRGAPEEPREDKGGVFGLGRGQGRGGEEGEEDGEEGGEGGGGVGVVGGGGGVAEGGDGGGEVGGGGEGEALLLEDGAHGGGGGAEVAVLRRRGLGVAAHEGAAHVAGAL